MKIKSAQYRKPVVGILASAAGLVVMSMLVLSTCSDSSNDYSTGGGGGGTVPTREFVSGNLGNGASFSHVFTAAKSIPYYCRYHGARGGVGMSGTITVNSGGTPSRVVVSIISSKLPDLTIDVGDTVVWTNNTPLVHTVESDN